MKWALALLVLVSCGPKPEVLRLDASIDSPHALQTLPASPGSSRTFVLKGAAPAGARVRIFPNDGCLAPQLKTVEADELEKGVTLSAVPGRENRFTLDAVSAAGAQSACSDAIVYFWDQSQVPPAPRSAYLTPASPSANRRPSFIAQVGDAGVKARLYLNGTCTPPFALEAAATGLRTGIQIEVPANASTFVSADLLGSTGLSSECSSAVTYEHDDVPPAPVAVTATIPSSPSSERRPRLTYTTSTESVGLQFASTPDCQLSLTRTQFGFPTRVLVPAAATTVIHTRAVDRAGNASACTAGVSYTHDPLLPPDPPDAVSVITLNGEPYSIGGEAQTECTLSLFAGPGCQGTPLETAPTGNSGYVSLQLDLADAGLGSLSFRLVNAANVASACVTRNF